MKKIFLSILHVIPFLTGLQFDSARAQNKIKVTLMNPPPNQLSVGNVWKMTLDNLTDSPLSIYLVGTVDKDNIRVVDGTSASITLPPGKSNYNYRSFETGSVNWYDNDLKKFVIKTGTVPAGIYGTCMQAFSSENYIPLSIQTCIIIPVVRVPAAEITLISPPDGGIIVAKPIFSWSSPVSKGLYNIVIKEMKEGQSREQAMNENKDFLNKKGIRTTSYQYGAADPKMQEGKDYVWRIGLNDVWSEIWVYRPKPFPGRKFSCKDFKVSILKNDTCKTCRDSCCYSLSITNNYGGLKANSPQSFRIIINNASIVSAAGVPKGWNQSPSTFLPNTNNIVWNKKSGPLPTGITNITTICLGNVTTDPFYVTYELMNPQKKVICKDSVKVNACVDSSCQNNLIRNGEFLLGNQPGLMPSPGAVQYWTRGYGSPTVDNNPSEGFIEQGYIKLSGSLDNGQSVVQGLDPINKIVVGKKYRLSVAVKFTTSQNTLNYVKIRAIAFNGNIFTTGGNHPQPSSDVAIISRSGKVRDCNDWSVIEFPAWTANKDFSNIAINTFTNDNSSATVFIDDVKLCEATNSDCEEVQLDDNGSPIMPTGYGDLPQGFTCQPEAEEDEYYNGSLQDLYPGYNGTTDLYSQGSILCPSIGGTLPPEVNNYNCNDSLKAAGIDMTCEELQSLFDKPFEPPPTKQLLLPPIPPTGNSVCDTPNIKQFNDMAFHGRDIIFVHGLQLKHLSDRFTGEQGATGVWPNNQNEFYSNAPNTPGYYKHVAVMNWAAHINYFLRGKGNKNRYLIVAYDCSESAEVAVHSILTQIREAMEHGTDVVAVDNDPRKTNCFGRDYVMVSHSTGSLVGDVALSIANKTKTPGSLQNQYGDIGLISDRCKGRVSLRGAFSGSNLAKLVCTIQQNQVLFTIALNALSSTSTVGMNSLIIGNSILVDLVPEVTRARWGNYINEISVPVFTIASGHPSALIGPLKPILLSGFDDGVENMDAANGTNNSLFLGASSFIANPIKVFDMGIPLIRAIDYFLDQKRNVPGVFAAASTVYLSPTGMIEPVISVPGGLDPQNHFNNHFSFVQSSSEHLQPNITDLKNYFDCNYWYTSIEGSINNEEELVVSNSSLFTPGLIDPSIISKMGESLKDRHIWYPWIKIVFRRGLPRITIYWKKFYIWKRTYHKLNDNCMYDVDYAYKYLFKQ